MRGNWFIAFQLRQNFAGKLFTKFNAPLVKTKNVPYYTLHKNFMLVKSNKASQCVRRNLFYKKRVGWLVAFKNFKRQYLFYFLISFDGIRQFLFYFFLMFAFHQCFSLRKVIAQQFLMMVANKIVANCRRNKIAWN